jgi:hypothetical protein
VLDTSTYVPWFLNYDQMYFTKKRSRCGDCGRVIRLGISTTTIQPQNTTACNKAIPCWTHQWSCVYRSSRSNGPSISKYCVNTSTIAYRAWLHVVVIHSAFCKYVKTQLHITVIKCNILIQCHTKLSMKGNCFEHFTNFLVVPQILLIILKLNFYWYMDHN